MNAFAALGVLAVIFSLAWLVSFAGNKLWERANRATEIPAPHWSPESPAERASEPSSGPLRFTVPRFGMTSWYGEDYRGKPTASGELFNPDEFTCASWDYPFGAVLMVTNTATNESVLVRVNDRGPSRRFVPQGRILDLSARAFAKIAPLSAGLVNVRIVRLVNAGE